MIQAMSPLGSFAKTLSLLMLALVLMSSPAEARKKGKKARKSQKANQKAKATQTSPRVQAEDPAELEPVEMDMERVLTHARALTKLGPRPANSEQARAAAAYIKAELATLGLEVEEQVVGSQTAEAIDLAPLYTAPEYSFTTQDVNLIVRIPVKGYTKDMPLLFMAHYDSVPASPGAVDNAVSVGLLLELARYLKHGDPMRTIVLVWTAAEENRLAGSLPLAEKFGEHIALAASLDLIGSPGTLTLNGLSSPIGRGWMMWLAEVSKQADIDISAPWTHRVVSLLFPELERSDHGSFTALGVPAFHLYTRGDERIYLPYHTPHDTMAQVDRKSVEDAAAFLTAMCDTSFALPKAGGNQGLWVPLPGNPKVSTTLAAQAAEFMFLFFAIMSLVKMRRATRDAPQENKDGSEGRKLGLGAALGAYVLVWLCTALLVAIASPGGHDLVWVHAPGRFIIASLLIAASLGYLLAAQATRFGTWTGESRYLIPSVALTGLLGFIVLSFGVFELAWIFLWPSAALGGIGRAQSRLRSGVVWFLAALPLLAPLAPGFLRESVFHGFFPSGISLSSYLAFFVFPQSMALVFLARQWKPMLPRGKGAMIGCGAVVLLGLIIVASYSAPCSESEYKLEGLACEIGR